jgi:thiol-disulfide isomerase/thioredoxin
LLAQEVVKKFAPRVQFAVQDLGASPLAEKYGVGERYPAIFVDDALVARPEDFYAWGGPPTGKYLPWSEAKNRTRFQNDLQRMIEIRLAGETLPSMQISRSQQQERFLPKTKLVDLNGRSFNFEQLRGKKVFVEFWATWCPYCIDTLSWLKKVDAPNVEVVAIAVDSERKAIDEVMAKYQFPGRVAIGTDPLRNLFDGPPAVPTILIADEQGKITKVFYGAPKDLHAQIERELKR